jgi:hypothetical protein
MIGMWKTVQIGLNRHGTIRLLPGLILAAGLAACSDPMEQPAKFSWTTFAEPEESFRPWVRWWWPGNDVDAVEIRREVELLAAHGFGGAEIQAFDAALNPQPDDPTELERRRSVDTEAFRQNIATALEAALGVGLSIDLNLGSGWSTGGLHVSQDDSMQTLLWSEIPVQGPGTFRFTLNGPDPTPFYTLADLAAGIGEPLARNLTDSAKLVAVVAGKVLEDGRDPEIFNLIDQVRLDRDSMRVVTDLVAGSELEIEVEAGDWRVIAFWTAPDGEYISLAALPGTGFVVDHFSDDRVRANLEHFLGDNSGLAQWFGTSLRGFFNDSFELKAERHFTDDFLAAFRERRGYDPVPFLPAMVPPGADDHIFDGAGIRTAAPFSFEHEDDLRLQYDYARTVSDLFIERFVSQSTSWGRARGLASRIQPYGIRIDVIEAAGVAAIPEAEQLYAGGSELFIKVVSSGAHLYGRPLVSAESLVWAGRDWMTTPRKAKAAVDKLFTAGVNHLVFHGFPYRTGRPEFGETDWHPFSSPWSGIGTYSTGISESDPFWPFQADLNRYVARCQYALRLGSPSVDLAVYYPWLGVPASLARLEETGEFLFQGRFEDEPGSPQNALFGIVDGLFGGRHLGPAVDWLAAVWPVLQALEDRGYTWEWINDKGLSQATGTPEGINVLGNRYKAILVPGAPYMTVAAASGLVRAGERGGAIVLSGGRPQAQPGFLDRENGDRTVRQAMEKLGNFIRVREASMPSEIDAILADLGVEPGLRHRVVPQAARHVERVLEDGSRLVFLRNPEPAARSFEFEVPKGCEGALWADPWDGSVRNLVPDASGFMRVNVAAYGSGLLLCGAEAPHAGTSIPPMEPPVRGVPVDGWTLHVEGAGDPGTDADITGNVLGDWRTLDGLEKSAGPGIYRARTSAGRPEAGERAFLDLGWMHGVARVSVGGVDAGVAVVPPYRVDISDILDGSEIDIEVVLVPPLRNHLLGLGDAGDPAAVQFRKKAETAVAAGLIGPVRITFHR